MSNVVHDDIIAIRRCPPACASQSDVCVSLQHQNVVTLWWNVKALFRRMKNGCPQIRVPTIDIPTTSTYILNHETCLS